MATYYRVNLKDKKNNVVYPNIHNNITIENDTGMMHLERKLGDTMFLCKRTDTGTEVRFGVGSGGTNHGIWSGPLDKWMVYADANKIYLNGNAETASKWQTARTLTLNGSHQASVTFDGSANITLTDWGYYSAVTQGNTNNYPYHRIGYVGTITSNYYDAGIFLSVSRNYTGGGQGLAWIQFRTNNMANGDSSAAQVHWIIRDNLPVDCIQVGFCNKSTGSYLDIFYKTDSNYQGCVFKELTNGGRRYMSRRVTLINSSEVDNTTTSDKKASVEAYKSISDAASKLHGGAAYTSTIVASDQGYVTRSGYSDKVISSLTTSSHIAGNQGTAIINSTADGNGYTMLAKMNSTNGKFTLGSWNTTFRLFYTTNTIVNAGTNSYTYAVTLLDENGNANFPKQVRTGGRVYIAFGGTADANAVPKFSESCLRISAPNATKYNPSIGFEESGSSDGTLCMRGRALYWSSTSAASGEVPAANTKYKLWHAGNFAGGVKGLSSKSHSNWGTNNGYVPNMSFIAFWNGAYASNKASNLTYAHQGTIQCKPTSLYDNSTGTTGTVTLSQSAANFTYLTIFTRDDDNHYSSRDVYSPNRKSVYFISGYPQNNSSQGFCNIKMSISYINGTTISRTRSTFLNTTGGETTIQAVAKHYIVKVIGYK